MHILTYSPEVSKQAGEFLKALTGQSLRWIQQQSDEEGCGAFVCAWLFAPEIGER